MASKTSSFTASGARSRMVNRTGISVSNALARGLGSLVSFLRAVVLEPVHIELVVVAGTSLG
jgi:hypothetical protein